MQTWWIFPEFLLFCFYNAYCRYGSLSEAENKTKTKHAFKSSSYWERGWLVPLVRVDGVHSHLWDGNSTEGSVMWCNQQPLHRTFYPDPQVQSGQMWQPWWGSFFILSLSSHLSSLVIESWSKCISFPTTITQLIQNTYWTYHMYDVLETGAWWNCGKTEQSKRWGSLKCKRTSSRLHKSVENAAVWVKLSEELDRMLRFQGVPSHS